MKILVTGGAGYIGSAMTRFLVGNGHEVVVYDNLSEGNRDAVDTRAILIDDDLGNREKLASVFKTYSFDAVIHFGGVLSVAESMKNPGKYFSINTGYTAGLLDVMAGSGVRNIIFSSTAGVYGNPVTLPIPESHPKNPTHAYGESKLMIERLLYWYDQIYGIKSVALRYFNAAGATIDGVLGERHKTETHIIPLAIVSILHNTPFKMYGTDYQTPDGTCLRDYIHIEDLCTAHLLALNNLKKTGKSTIYNVGTGNGISNKQVVEAIEKVSRKKVIVEYANRREGDPDRLVADPSNIKKELGWEPKYSDIDTIVETAWKFHKNNNGN